jgi:hypothetical protein
MIDDELRKFSPEGRNTMACIGGKPALPRECISKDGDMLERDARWFDEHGLSVVRRELARLAFVLGMPARAIGSALQ